MATNVALVRASQTILIDADLDITEGETVVVAGKTYTFNATLGSGDGDVDLGADAAGHRANLVAAINLDAAGSGVQYAAAMTRNPHVYAVDNGVDTVTVYAYVPGALGNLIPVDAGTSAVTPGAATLAGGSGDLADFFDGLFELNPISAEIQAALAPFAPSHGGVLD